MLKNLIIAVAVTAYALSGPAFAQQSSAPKSGLPIETIAAKMKQCRTKCPSGEVKRWSCPADGKCCVWKEICYVKCGNQVTGCL